MGQQRSLIMILVTACVIIAAGTSVFLFVQGRPDAPAEGAAAEGVAVEGDALAAEGQAAQSAEAAAAAPSQQAIPTVDPNGARVGFSVTIEDTEIQLQPVDAEQIIIAPVQQPVIVVEDTTPPQQEPAEEVVVNQEPTAIPEEQPADQQQDPTPAPPPSPTPLPVVTNPTPIPDSNQQPAAANGTVLFVDHVVQAGETMYSIARLHNSTVELMAENRISSEDVVVGDVLRIPVANPAYCPTMRVYIVRDADTVYRIALNNNSTKEAIRDVNNLGESYAIKAGQIICIP